MEILPSELTDLCDSSPFRCVWQAYEEKHLAAARRRGEEKKAINSPSLESLLSSPRRRENLLSRELAELIRQSRA